jgi:hypothetical protein
VEAVMMEVLMMNLKVMKKEVYDDGDREIVVVGLDF